MKRVKSCDRSRWFKNKADRDIWCYLKFKTSSYFEKGWQTQNYSWWQRWNQTVED